MIHRPTLHVNRTLAAVTLALGTAVCLLQFDVVGRFAYAVERGKRAAEREHLRLTAQDVAPLERLSESYAKVCEVARPSVVFIEALSRNPAVEERFEKLFGKENVRAEPSVGTGSGVIIDEDGHIVTNNHVVEKSERVNVTLEDGRRFRATIIGADLKTDLALLKINADGLHPAALANSDEVRIGHIVLAIGSPFRLGHSVSHGIISAIGRSDVNVNIDYQNWLQTDAPINPGNSGGPLFNTRGEVVGINTAIATENGGHQGVGFAIPSNVVSFIAGRLKTDRMVVRGVLGVVIEKVTPQMAVDCGLDDAVGVLVRNVADNSPAKAAGLLAEDVILELCGKMMHSREQLQELVAATRPGTKAPITIWRQGKKLILDVVIGRQPDDFSTSGSLRDLERWHLPGDERDNKSHEDLVSTGSMSDAGLLEKLGLSAETLTMELVRKFEVDAVKSGVIITAIQPDSEAHAARLQPGHIVVAANGRPVKELGELVAALSRDSLTKGVRLKVKGLGEEFSVVLQMQ